MSIVNLTVDSDHRKIIDDEVWYEFTCSYVDFEGKNFIFTLWARSREEVEERLVCLKKNATIDGMLIKEIENK